MPRTFVNTAGRQRLVAPWCRRRWRVGEGPVVRGGSRPPQELVGQDLATAAAVHGDLTPFEGAGLRDGVNPLAAGALAKLGFRRHRSPHHAVRRSYTVGGLRSSVEPTRPAGAVACQGRA